MVEFMGFVFDRIGNPVFIWRWSDCGTAWEYVERNPGVDRFSLVCIFAPCIQSVSLTYERCQESREVSNICMIWMSCTQI